MNDFDDTTFARFARRFARIEQLVPQPVTPAFASVTYPKRGGAVMLRSVILLGATVLLGLALALAAIGSRPSPTVTLPPASLAPTAAPTMPPDSADATTVLTVYLGALQAGNCDLAGQLVGTYSSHTWNDALCGGVTRITGFKIPGDQSPSGRLQRGLDPGDPHDDRHVGRFTAGRDHFHIRFAASRNGAMAARRLVPWRAARSVVATIPDVHLDRYSANLEPIRRSTVKRRADASGRLVGSGVLDRRRAG